MAGYKYDSEGGQFLTFVLTFLLLVLVPLTWSLLSSSTKATRSQGWFDARGQKISSIKALNPRIQVSKKTVVVLVGWTVAAYLIKLVANAAKNSQHSVYDPFSILGIAASATEKEIKKHYKRLSVKFHPDKIQLSANQTKEAVEAHYIELTKAYKALTDDTIRKNFELYGHPDGRQEMSMGIALPTWVVESQNNVWVLGAYAIIFGLTLPYVVARWWYGSRSKTKDGVITGTAQTYFRHLREDTPPSRIIALLAVSEEFKDDKINRKGMGKDEFALREIESEVRLRLKPYGPKWDLLTAFRSTSIRKAVILMYAHLFRIETPSPALKASMHQIAPVCVDLLSGMLQIALAHNWSELTDSIITMTQCFVQAVPPCDEAKVAELLQLGGLQRGAAKALVDKSELAAQGIQGFWAMDDKERREVVGVKEIGDKQYDHMVKIAGEWPRLELVDAFFKVTGERLVTSGAIVQFIVKAKLLPPSRDETLLAHGTRSSAVSQGPDIRSGADDEVTAQTDSLGGTSLRDDSASSSAEGKQTLGVARCPRFARERKPQWYVYLTDVKQSRVIVQPTLLTDIGPDRIRTFTLQFQAPPNPGLYTFSAHIRSNSYLGTDANRYVQLQVEDPSVLDIRRRGEDDDEDDISEPDEDTLAGQMALMRGEKVKPSPVHGMGRDSDDEDEDEDEDSDDSEPSDSDTEAEGEEEEEEEGEEEE